LAELEAVRVFEGVYRVVVDKHATLFFTKKAFVLSNLEGCHLSDT
jgi:hypothetical protein